MASHRPRRALADAPMPAAGRGWKSFRSSFVDVVLWTLGCLGLMSLFAAVAAHVFGFSIVLFSTGSMTPTIPAGSAALVRLLPASHFQVGDITTVERPNLLPITHRITSIKPLDGSPSARIITMRGDANDQDDPEPYVISHARIVVAAVPGVAQIFSGMRNPLLMLVLALLAGGLVTWAFWPRTARSGSIVAAVALVAASPLLGASEAQAAETEREVAGQHIVLTVISDAEAMGSMVPGLPVLWQVGVNTSADEEGQLHIGLGVTGAVDPEALTVDVRACTVRWQGESCTGARQTWLPATTLDHAFLPATHQDSREFGTTPAGTPVWILVRVRLTQSTPGIMATMKLAAWGGGEVVEAVSDGNGAGNGGKGGLAYTGSDGTLETLTLAGAAIVSGLVVARLAGRHRRESDPEVLR